MCQPTSAIKHRRKRTLKFKTDHNFLNITVMKLFFLLLFKWKFTKASLRLACSKDFCALKAFAGVGVSCMGELPVVELSHSLQVSLPTNRSSLGARHNPQNKPLNYLKIFRILPLYHTLMTHSFLNVTSQKHCFSST